MMPALMRPPHGPGQKAETTMSSTTTAPRFVIVNARGALADDLGDQGRGENFGWESEEAAEVALENLAETTGWELLGYSVREATAEEIAHNA